MILSVSRRTDIPSYYSEWFLTRLQEGYVLTRNPLNHAQISRIKLSPDNIDCIVFWTKDPANLLDKLSLIDSLGYQYYFQFTLTPYDHEMERNLRDKKNIIAIFQQLSKLIGRDKVLWRYDPIIINTKLSMDYHFVEFEKLCQALCGYTDVCTISFVDSYQKLSKSVKDTIITPISEEQMKQVAAQFVKIAKEYHIKLKACCETIDLSSEEVEPASCIDPRIVEKVCGHPVEGKKDKNQRQGCGCIQSIDIGVYNTCRNGCVYCYANHSDTSIQRNVQKHDPTSDILIGRVGQEEIIRDRK